MKKILSACMIMFISYSGFAQIGKGRILVGVDLGFQNQKNLQYDDTSRVISDEVTKSLNLGIRFGYFITDHVAVGLYGGIANGSNVRTNYTFPSKTNNNSSSNLSDNSSSAFNIGLFGRYYQMIGSTRFAAFGQLSAGFGTGKSEVLSSSTNSAGVITINPSTTGSSSNINLMLRPGVAFFLTDMVAFEAQFGGLGYQMNSQKDFNKDKELTEHTTTNSFYSTMNLNLSSITFGLTFFFGGSGGSSTTTTTK